MHELDYIFYPRSIAFVGVSANQNKFGGGDWLKVIQELGFKGKLYPVNPKLTRYSGLKVYPSIKEIPGSVDLTMVSIPSRFIPQLIEDCVSKGVKVVHLYTAGFSENGNSEGARLEVEIAEIAYRGGLRGRL